MRIQASVYYYNTTMKLLLLAVLLASALAGVVKQNVKIDHIIQAYDEEYIEGVTVCKWGTVRPNHNDIYCAKGPGESCGGILNYMGFCHPDMLCHPTENICLGCYFQRKPYICYL